MSSQRMATWREAPKPLSPDPSPVLRRAAMTSAPVKDAPLVVEHALRSPGHTLDGATRAFMEPRFGYDFSGVRVHSDGLAGQSAQSVGALAYTVGQDLVFQPGLYNPHSLQGKQLLAHELSHVVQQAGSSSLQASRVGPAGDRCELEADQAARQVAAGNPAAVRPASSAAQVQRQPDPNTSGTPTVSITRSLSSGSVPRSECEAALADFLRKAQQEQGGQSLRVTPAVRAVLERIANLPDPKYTGPGGDPGRAVRTGSLDSWLNGTLPGSPDEFARQAARFLPDPCSAEALRILGKAPAGEPAPGTLGRIRDLIDKSAPAEPGEKQKQLEEQRQPTSTEKVDQYMEDQRKRSSVQEKKVGPYSVDLLRLGRIGQGLPDALRGPKKAQPQPAELPPEVIRAAGQLSKNLLTPAGGNPDDYADVQEVALGLARELDSAYRNGQDQAVLDLGNTYSKVKDLEPIFSGIRQIAEKMRQALPHHATGVRSVNVVLGGQMVRVLPLAPIQTEEKK